MDRADEDGLKHYEVEFSESAQSALLDVSSRDDALKVRRRLLMVEVAPGMGVVYDPVYESSMPDHEVRVTFAGHYGLYYLINDEESKVIVEYVEDCRRNPLNKFSEAMN